ncbi:MAG: hypothetical protein AABO58_23845 [Acidobacteriota bacterium]
MSQITSTWTSKIQRWITVPAGAGLILGVLLVLFIESLTSHARAVEWRILEIVGLLLALGTLIYDKIQDRHQETTQECLQTTLEQLTKLQQSLSTRYLGQFPRFVDNIAEELEKAQTSIHIMCDMPAYGAFNAQRGCLRYKQVLQRKASEGISIELTCLDAKTRRKHEDEQFSEKVWARWQNDEQQKQRVVKFLAARRTPKPENADRETFVKALDELDFIFLKDVFPQTPYEVSIEIPIYLWIIDGTSAIFALPSSTDKDEWDEYGFITSDERLIKAFQDMRTRYHQRIGASRLPALDDARNRDADEDATSPVVRSRKRR